MLDDCKCDLEVSMQHPIYMRHRKWRPV